MENFDVIISEQVKCFGYDFYSYKLGDKVPCDECGYNSNMMIVPFDFMRIHKSIYRVRG